MTTNELASFLRKLSDKIAEGRVELSQGDKSVVLRIPKTIDVEIEVEEEKKTERKNRNLKLKWNFTQRKRIFLELTDPFLLFLFQSTW